MLRQNHNNDITYLHTFSTPLGKKKCKVILSKIICFSKCYCSVTSRLEDVMKLSAPMPRITMRVTAPNVNQHKYASNLSSSETIDIVMRVSQNIG